MMSFPEAPEPFFRWTPTHKDRVQLGGGFSETNGLPELARAKCAKMLLLRSEDNQEITSLLLPLGG